MRRARLPRYGKTRRGLTDDRVKLIRSSGEPDGYYARIWGTTSRTIRLARTGRTWCHVATPPDLKPRCHVGNWGDLADTSTPSQS